MDNHQACRSPSSRGPGRPSRSGQRGADGCGGRVASNPARGLGPEGPTAVWVVPTPGHAPPVRAIVRVYPSRDFRDRETVKLRIWNEGRRPLPPITFELAVPLGPGLDGAALGGADSIYPLGHDSGTGVRPGSGVCYILQGDMFAEISHRAVVLGPDATWCRLVARGQEIGRVPVRGLQALLRGEE
ncbi:MAG: hypothetical protein JWO38_8342 [Gemmataceae bacterium]|nr:hypothetical protein [Gemmataceae bacterium]